MASASPSRRERAQSDRAQAMPGIAQRPAMGGRTTSAPVGELYKLDARKPGGSVNTLVEEDEGSPTAEARRSRQNEVRLDLIARMETQLLTVLFLQDCKAGF